MLLHFSCKSFQCAHRYKIVIFCLKEKYRYLYFFPPPNPQIPTHFYSRQKPAIGCCTDSQDQSLHGSWNKRHFSHKSSIEISSGKYRKCKQNHLFLSKLWCQFIYRNVKDQRQSCHSNKVQGCHSLRKLQKAGNKKGKSCLKHGKRDPKKKSDAANFLNSPFLKVAVSEPKADSLDGTVST